jgi:hypothetical protein
MQTFLSVDEQLKQIITPGGKSLYAVQLRRARATAIILALATVVSLIFLTFAFVQKAATETAREHAVKNEALARQFEVELRECQQLNNK